MRTRVFLIVLLLAGCQAERTPQEQAVDLYADAGIEVDAIFETGGFYCTEGIWAYYDSLIERIIVCQPDHPKIVTILVHEIAHHLDREHLTDEARAGLMELWGVESWVHGEWVERGAELFAESVTLSLLPDAEVWMEVDGGLEALVAAMP